MTTPKNLRKFLTREVLTSRIKPPKDLNLNPLSIKRREEALAEETYLLHNSASQTGHETDSIFGEHLPTPQEKKASQLNLLLKTVAAKKAKAQRREKSEFEIEELRAELKLINQKEGEEEIDERELNLIARRKEVILKEILRLGCGEKVKVKSSKGLTRAKMNEELADFPPPLTRAERRKFQREKDNVERVALDGRLYDSSTGGAFATQIRKTRSKRSTPEIDLEDLDGEERFRLFGSPKIKRRRGNKDGAFREVRVERNYTGRWMSEIHDYYPEGGMGDHGGEGEEGEVEGVDVKGWLGKIKEDRELGVLLRREVMEVNKEAFRRDRIKRRREGL